MRKNFVRKYTSPDKHKVNPFLAISEKKIIITKLKKTPNKQKTYYQRDVSFLIHFVLYKTVHADNYYATIDNDISIYKKCRLILHTALNYF